MSPLLNQQSPFLPGFWIGIQDGDPRGLYLFKRHYSYHTYRDNRPRKLFIGPGEKVVLLTFQCNALFVWRKFKSDDGQTGINCSIFRNESPILSSTLIREAVQIAWQKWPGERLYTYVNARKVRSTNPGCCFKKAGWKRCGQTKRGLLIFEIFPPSTANEDTLQ